MLETGGGGGGGGRRIPLYCYICDVEMTNYDTRKIKIGGPKFICTYIGIACKSVYIATYTVASLKKLCVIVNFSIYAWQKMFILQWQTQLWNCESYV